jgi:hypothetical protein
MKLADAAGDGCDGGSGGRGGWVLGDTAGRAKKPPADVDADVDAAVLVVAVAAADEG